MSGLVEFDKRREVFRFVEDVCCAGGGFDERQMVAIPAIVGGLFVDGLCVGGTSDQAGSCRAFVFDKHERASGMKFHFMFFDALKPLYLGHLRTFYVFCLVCTGFWGLTQRLSTSRCRLSCSKAMASCFYLGRSEPSKIAQSFTLPFSKAAVQ